MRKILFIMSNEPYVMGPLSKRPERFRILATRRVARGNIFFYTFAFNFLFPCYIIKVPSSFLSKIKLNLHNAYFTFI